MLSRVGSQPDGALLVLTCCCPLGPDGGRRELGPWALHLVRGKAWGAPQAVRLGQRLLPLLAESSAILDHPLPCPVDIKKKKKVSSLGPQGHLPRALYCFLGTLREPPRPFKRGRAPSRISSPGPGIRARTAGAASQPAGARAGARPRWP